MPIPPVPDASSAVVATATVPVRYEDVAQDGRLVLEALPTALGEAVWRSLVAPHPLTAWMRASKAVPILTRMIAEGGRGPMSVVGPLTARGQLALAHVAGPDGEVQRLVLNMWAEVTAPTGRTYGAPPPRAGEPHVAGRLFAEHVFTRPFAAPDARKVLRFDGADLPEIPPHRYEPTPLEALLEPPPGATALEPAIEADATRTAFGLAHTDSNQHVNSLVYPRLFEEATLRRLADLGKPTTLLARELDRVEIQ